MILFYEKSPKELYECSIEELFKRLYKVTILTTSSKLERGKMYSYGKIECRHHSEARKSSELEKKRGAWKAGETYRPIITLSYLQLNAFVEGQDFELHLDGHIKFKH